jgi:hypothetical protein
MMFLKSAVAATGLMISAISAAPGQTVIVDPGPVYAVPYYAAPYYAAPAPVIVDPGPAYVVRPYAPVPYYAVPQPRIVGPYVGGLVVEPGW